MRIGWDAAAIVAHGDPALGGELQFDAGGKPGHRLVHRLVERLGGEMVQSALVGAADIHPGAAAHRFEALEDLDVLGGIALGRMVGSGGSDAVEKVSHGSIIGGLASRASSMQYTQR